MLTFLVLPITLLLLYFFAFIGIGHKFIFSVYGSGVLPTRHFLFFVRVQDSGRVASSIGRFPDAAYSRKTEPFN